MLISDLELKTIHQSESRKGGTREKSNFFEIDLAADRGRVEAPLSNRKVRHLHSVLPSPRFSLGLGLL